MDRLTDTTGDLPTILRAHNEEVRALKHKLKQVSRGKSINFLGPTFPHFILIHDQASQNAFTRISVLANYQYHLKQFLCPKKITFRFTFIRSSFQVYEQKREKERKLDQRDSQLFKMREVNSSLRDLARNKQLDQREKLKSSLDTTQDMLSAREDEVKASRIDASHSGGIMPQKQELGLRFI